VELTRVAPGDIAGLRQEKIASFHVPLLPNFHAHLAGHADAFAVKDAKSTVGYALLLFDRHEGHDHVTLIELYLTPPYRDRYEDVLDLVADLAEPRAYLARSDDCTFETALIAMGYQMEMSMSLMVARAAFPPPDGGALGLVPLDYPHLRAAQELYDHVRGPEQSISMSELERAIEDGNLWVLTDSDNPIGLIVQEESQGAHRYALLDVLAPHVSDEKQVWAILTAGRQLEAEGLAAAAVVDPREVRKIGVFRQAGYYTAATYLIFYDPEAGRVKVPVISRDDLWAMIQSGQRIRVIDVMGEDHWQRGHLPGAEWIDYRHLTREARQRFDKGETIVVYCNDYT